EADHPLNHKLRTIWSRLAGGSAAVAICGFVLVVGYSTAIASADNNPLALPVAPTNGNPLSGARFFVDHENAVSLAARGSPLLRVISDQPGTARFGAFSGSNVGRVVHDYLVRAWRQEPGTVPLLATYRVVDGHCGNWTPTSGDQAAYHGFNSSFA